MKQFKNILLINFGGIGDEILFLPVIQCLRKTYPNAKITLCLEGRSKSFVNLTDLINDYFCVDIKTKNKYLQMLKLYFKALFGRYDLVISSGANSLIPVLLFLTGIKTRIGYKSSKLSEKLLTYQYAANMYFDLVKPVSDLPFELPCIKSVECEKFPESVLIHPGVSKISVNKKIVKTVSAEIWAEIIKKLLLKGKKVHLAGGPDDYDIIDKIKKNLLNYDLTNFFDMYGKTKNIYDLAKLIKSSEILICSDSAPMHISVALNTKTIAIFGPTDENKLLPKSNNFIAITNNCDCRPCLWDKRNTTCEKLDCLNLNIENILKLI